MLTSRLYAWSRAHVAIVDRLIMLGMLATFGFASVASAYGGLPAFFSVATIALLAFRRRWPVAVMVVMVVLSLAQVVLVPTLLPANVAQLYVIYTVAAHVPSFRTRLVALGFGFLGSILGALRFEAGSLGRVAFSAFFLALAVGLVWVVGNLIRGRESIIEQLSESNAILRRDREQRDLIAAQGERAKMAREMHDIVAHSLSVVVVQAHGGAYAAEHAERWERADATRTLSPGDRGGLTRDVDLAAYRVVQESLTNVLKHAGTGATAHVDVTRVPGALRVSVSDDGEGGRAAGDGLGNGIVGMRERVSASRGQLLAGPRAGGGFAVTATIPVADVAPVPAPAASEIKAEKALHG